MPHIARTDEGYRVIALRYVFAIVSGQRSPQKEMTLPLMRRKAYLQGLKRLRKNSGPGKKTYLRGCRNSILNHLRHGP